MLKLLEKIYMLNLAPVSSGSDKLVKILSNELPFSIHEEKSDNDYNGWVIPKKWEVLEANIYKNGTLIYDGLSHPLAVASLSKSFSGNLNYEELSKHIFYSQEMPDHVVYHWKNQYSQNTLDWGFCVPLNQFLNWDKGEYTVNLRTHLSNGTMKTLDFFLEGESEEEILINAHSCHAGQANDDASGIVVGVEIFKKLMKRKNRKFSYRLIICPEIFGTAFWLKNLAKDKHKNIKYCILLKAVGNNDKLKLQKSFNGDTILDEASLNALYHLEPNPVFGGFREIYGNDETVFEAPGFEIPTITFTRVKPIPGPMFREYHTSADNMSIIKEKKLEETVKTVLRTLQIIEDDFKPIRNFDGLLCLSNPKYNLYISAADPSISTDISLDQRNWYMFMTCFTRYIDGNTTLLQMANKHKLPFEGVKKYIQKFENLNLICRG